MTLLEQIDRLRELAEAQADGKQVQIDRHMISQWEPYKIDRHTPPDIVDELRIKPEPKSWWMVRLVGGGVRVFTDEKSAMDTRYAEVFEVVRKEPEA